MLRNRKILEIKNIKIWLIYSRKAWRFASAFLEIRTADLLAAKAELERQKEEEKVEIGDSFSDYYSITKQLNADINFCHLSRRRGSTSQMLEISDKRDYTIEKIF